MNRPIIFQKIKDLRTHRERGQAIVIIVLGLFALIAVAGLAVDGTLIYRAKQDLQRAIDSAALAAAYKLPSQGNASQTAYEFVDLHGYDFHPYPGPNQLDISFPDYTPPRKAVTVKGSTNVHLAFMSILGFHSVQISAQGEAEAAPLDVYLVLDLSESMTYNTYYTQRSSAPSPLPSWWQYKSDAIAQWCNAERLCDPLDIKIKPAAKYFIDKLDPLYDRVGLVVYDQVGTKIIGLTNDFEALKLEIDDLNAYDHQEDGSCCNKQTNIGDGILYAHNGIASEGSIDAIWSIVFLTDGKANVYRKCTGCPPNCGSCTIHLCEECDDAGYWAIKNAVDTWKRHETTIYTIAFGVDYSDYETLMINIADCTDDGVCNCTSSGVCDPPRGTTDNYWPAPDENELRNAFAEIAERIYSRLLR
jgi:hypothetical protein